MAKKQESEWQQITATFYSYKSDYNNFIEYVKEAMSNFLTEVKEVSPTQYELTLFDGSPISIRMTVDPEKVDEYTNGMAGFFAKAPVENQEVKKAALYQIKLFKYFASLTLYINGEKDRTNCLFSSFFHLADLAGAFTLTGDMRLVNSENKVLIAQDGSTDFDEYEPLTEDGVFRIKEDECDKERRLRTNAICAEKNIPYIEGKSVSIPEKDCKPASKDEIIHRLACVFAAAAVADTCYNTPDSSQSDVPWVRETLEKKYEISKYLSKYEASFVANPFEKQQYYATYLWRYECCLVLMWALGLAELDDPAESCDAHIITDLMFGSDFESLSKKAKVKSKEELLDKLDLIYRYNWACTEARIHGKTVDGLNAEVVYEWHYALNWLARVGGISDWDRIQPNT